MKGSGPKRVLSPVVRPPTSPFCFLFRCTATPTLTKKWINRDVRKRIWWVWVVLVVELLEPLSPSEWRDEQATTLSDVDYEPKTKCNGLLVPSPTGQLAHFNALHPPSIVGPLQPFAQPHQKKERRKEDKKNVDNIPVVE
jgi:hypothetical protein